MVKTEPLIFSPALPPIPAKVVDRVQSSKFNEFKGFLADNVLLLQRLQKLGLAGSVAPALQPLVSGSSLREVRPSIVGISLPCISGHQGGAQRDYGIGGAWDDRTPVGQQAPGSRVALI